MASHWLSLSLTETSYSIPENSSYVKATLTYSTDQYGSGAWYGDNPGEITINGTKYPFTKNGYSIGYSSTITIYTVTAKVPHNADGTKTVSASAWFNTHIFVGTLTASATKKLTDIPRASTLASCSGRNIGSATTITVNRADSSFTHKLWYHLPGQSWKRFGGDFGTSVTYTIPLAECSYFAAAISGRMDVCLETYKNGTKIGSTVYSWYTMNIPSSVVPSLSDIAYSEAASAVSAAFPEKFLQGQSQLLISISAVGVYGSTISSYTTVVDGVTYGEQQFTSNPIRRSGAVAVSSTVKDSRGRTATRSENITVTPYAPPSISKLVVTPCNSDGTQNSAGTALKISVSGKVAPVDNLNTKTLTIRHKKSSETAWTKKTITLAAGDWNFADKYIIVAGADPTVTYDIQATLTDKLGEDIKSTSTGIPIMSALAGGKGINFFGEAEREGLWVRDKVRYDFSQNFVNNMQLKAGLTSGRLDDYLEVMSYGQPIPQGSDLNNYVYEGVYAPLTFDIANSVVNRPSEVTNWLWRLDVKIIRKNPENIGTRIIQEITRLGFDNNKRPTKFSRAILTDSSGIMTFGDWVCTNRAEGLIIVQGGNYVPLTYMAYKTIRQFTLPAGTTYLCMASTIFNVADSGNQVLARFNWDSGAIMTYWLYTEARGTLAGGGGLHQSLIIRTLDNAPATVRFEVYGSVNGAQAKANIVAIPLDSVGFHVQ